jgi:type VI secretion system protein ImpA
METRLAALTGLNGADGNGTLIAPILAVPLTEGQGVGPYASYHCQQANALGQVHDEAVRARRLQEGAVSLEMIQQAVAQTSRAFYAQLVEDLGQCQEEFAQLTQLLDEKCGSQTPPSSNIAAALDACRDALNEVAADRLPVPEEKQAAAGPDVAENGKPAGRTDSPAAGPDRGGALQAIRTREDAFRTLLSVAEYFRLTEPHSVVSYGLEQVVRWGRMSLPDLLRELIADETPREQLFRQVGIRPAPVLPAAEDANGVPPVTAEPPRRNKWAPRQ